MKKTAFLMMTLAALLLAAGCGGGDDHDEHNGHDHGSGEDVHKAPHGGVLHMVVDHALYIEVAHDPESGIAILHILTGHGNKPMKIKQKTIEATVTPEGGTPFNVTFNAMTNKLTKDEPGNSSMFDPGSSQIKVPKFELHIQSLTAGGKEHKDIKIPVAPGGPSNDPLVKPDGASAP